MALTASNTAIPAIAIWPTTGTAFNAVPAPLASTFKPTLAAGLETTLPIALPAFPAIPAALPAILPADLSTPPALPAIPPTALTAPPALLATVLADLTVTLPAALAPPNALLASPAIPLPAPPISLPTPLTPPPKILPPNFTIPLPAALAILPTGPKILPAILPIGPISFEKPLLIRLPNFPNILPTGPKIFPTNFPIGLSNFIMPLPRNLANFPIGLPKALRPCQVLPPSHLIPCQVLLPNHLTPCQVLPPSHLIPFHAQPPSHLTPFHNQPPSLRRPLPISFRGPFKNFQRNPARLAIAPKRLPLFSSSFFSSVPASLLLIAVNKSTTSLRYFSSAFSAATSSESDVMDAPASSATAVNGLADFLSSLSLSFLSVGAIAATGKVEALVCSTIAGFSSPSSFLKLKSEPNTPLIPEPTLLKAPLTPEPTLPKAPVILEPIEPSTPKPLPKIFPKGLSSLPIGANNFPRPLPNKDPNFINGTSGRVRILNVFNNPLPILLIPLAILLGKLFRFSQNFLILSRSSLIFSLIVFFSFFSSLASGFSSLVSIVPFLISRNNATTCLR